MTDLPADSAEGIKSCLVSLTSCWISWVFWASVAFLMISGPSLSCPGAALCLMNFYPCVQTLSDVLQACCQLVLGNSNQESWSRILLSPARWCQRVWIGKPWQWIDGTTNLLNGTADLIRWEMRFLVKQPKMPNTIANMWLRTCAETIIEFGWSIYISDSSDTYDLDSRVFAMMLLPSRGQMSNSKELDMSWMQC